ncbi:MAG: hypothetical protein D6729_07835 [Deltaproteobacteria bacterium]|nr:MAG: hypothetical protein D6729_07835 [Deltaproteobacteria bacterium]
MSEDEEFGGELDLDAIEREATKVKRQALEIDFDEVVDQDFGHLGGGRAHGGMSLDADAFQSKKVREATERALGGTPTLKKLGERPAQPVRHTGPRMEKALNIRRALIPGWAWAVIAILIIGGGIAIGGVLFYRSYSARIAAEEALLKAARERALQAEEERVRRMGKK